MLGGCGRRWGMWVWGLGVWRGLLGVGVGVGRDSECECGERVLFVKIFGVFFWCFLLIRFQCLHIMSSSVFLFFFAHGSFSCLMTHVSHASEHVFYDSDCLRAVGHAYTHLYIHILIQPKRIPNAFIRLDCLLSRLSLSTK